MRLSPLAIALVQLARKRRVLDTAQCARLQILLGANEIATIVDARRFLATGGLLAPPIARKLLSHLPKDDQVHFGDYTPLVHLADGGMGSAWMAADADDVLVVIKTMKGSLAGNPEVRSRFEREMEIMQQLDHPNVVRALGSGAADDGSLYLALEFVDGGDLKDLMEAQGALPEALGLAICYQIADALTLAEAHKLVHRDIKPPNIFAEADGRAKLADFGIARSTAANRTQLTMQGAVVGSPYFMSPEQIKADESIATPSDIYALGAVLYTCLAGTEPYRGALQDVLHAHCTAPVPDIREVRPQVGHTTASIITRCMQKQIGDRYGAAADVRNALREALADLERHDALQLAAADSLRTPIGGETQLTQGQLQTMATATLGQKSTMAVTADEATLAVDLSVDPDATMAVDLAGAAVDPDATVAVDLVAGGGDNAATMNMDLAAAGGGQVVGDFQAAHNKAWLSLTGDDDVALVLIAKQLLVCGKLCEPPVDLCLRQYPSDQHRDLCLKVSRQHLRLQYAGTGGVHLTDLGSGNGTVVDGTPLQANHPAVLTNIHSVTVAKAVDLRMRVITKTGTETWSLAGAPASTGGFGCGIEVSHAVDAVTITRPDNRPNFGYAMVLRRLTIGDQGADLPLPALANTRLEVGLYDGRWIWRSDAHHPWQPMIIGQPIAIGGRQLTPKSGDYGIFQ